LRREEVTGYFIENAQKISSARAGNAVLSYGWCGLTRMADRHGKVWFDFSSESERVMARLSSLRIERFDDYVVRFAEQIYQGLLTANGGEKLTKNLTYLLRENEIARALIVGYFNGAPKSAQVRILYEGDTLTGTRLAQRNIFEFTVFSGPSAMLRKFEPRLQNAPATLDDGVALVRDYIQLCIDNRDQDEQCRAIGGHIHIASVTPTEFQWVIPPT